MKNRDRMAAMVAVAVAVFAIAGSSALAAPAFADTFPANPCAVNDVHVSNGTTVQLDFTGNCVYGGYVVTTGSPTVVVKGGGNDALVWHKAIEPAADGTCPQGWGSSWARWANGGNGGPTCVTDVVWGIGPHNNAQMLVTVNTATDHVNLGNAPGDYVTGCFYGDQGYPIIGNCL